MYVYNFIYIFAYSYTYCVDMLNAEKLVIKFNSILQN